MNDAEQCYCSGTSAGIPFSREEYRGRLERIARLSGAGIFRR